MGSSKLHVQRTVFTGVLVETMLHISLKKIPLAHMARFPLIISLIAVPIKYFNEKILTSAFFWNLAIPAFQTVRRRFKVTGVSVFTPGL